MNHTWTRPDMTTLANGRIPPLDNGDYLTRDEFERRYEAMPHLKKAELLDGVVYMSSAVRYRSHGQPHGRLVGWLLNYEAATPGVGTGDNSTVRLDETSEPQPDAALFILPEFGGTVQISADDYLEGSFDLAAEVAASSVSYDVRVKLPIYQKNGVREYIIWRVLDEQLDWYVLRSGQYELMPSDSMGMLRSAVFPGLWLDVAALLRGDMQTVLTVLQQGIASPEHARFVADLAARRR